MAILTIEILKSIVEKLPEDFEIELRDKRGAVYSVSDEVTVKVSDKKLMLRLY